MSAEIQATLLEQHGALTSGATVRLIQPLRDSSDWMVSDPFGYVMTIPSAKLRVLNRATAVMRLEAARQDALIALQQHTSSSEQAMSAARSYEISRLLDALPKSS
jgi:hypothetical protein